MHKALDLFQGKKEEREGGSEGVIESGSKAGEKRRKQRKEGRIHTAYGFNLGSYINKKYYFTYILQIKVIILLL